MSTKKKSKARAVSNSNVSEHLSPSQREMIILERLESMNNRMNEMAAMQASPRNNGSFDSGSPGSPKAQAPALQPSNPYASYGALSMGPGAQEANEAQMLAFRQKTYETEEMAFVITGLQAKLSEAQDELIRMATKLENETKERRKLEQRNADLNGKLSEARQGLRDTQSALQSVQQATEQLTVKRDQRDIQLQRVLAENKAFDGRIYELEVKLRESENACKSIATLKEETAARLTEQLNLSQEACFKAQGEVVRMKGERTLIDTEIESLKRKMASVESRAKTNESALEADHQVMLGKLEDRIRSLNEKIEDLKPFSQRCIDLEDEIKSKLMEIKIYENKLHEMEGIRKDLENRISQLESTLRMQEMSTRQAEARASGLDQDIASALSEVAMLKRSSIQSEETLRQVAQQLSMTVAEKDGLQAMVETLHRRIDQSADFPEQAKKLAKDLDKSRVQIDDQRRQMGDLERQLRFANEDKHRTNEQLQSTTGKLGALTASYAEAKQLLVMANQRITELYAEVGSLNEKLGNSGKGLVIRSPGSFELPPTGAKKSKGLKKFKSAAAAVVAAEAFKPSNMQSSSVDSADPSPPLELKASMKSPKTLGNKLANAFGMKEDDTANKGQSADKSEKNSRKKDRARSRSPGREKSPERSGSNSTKKKEDRARSRSPARGRSSPGREKSPERSGSNSTKKKEDRARSRSPGREKSPERYSSGQKDGGGERKPSPGRPQDNPKSNSSSAPISRNLSKQVSSLGPNDIVAPTPFDIANASEERVEACLKKKKKLKKAIAKWNDDFVRLNKRDPTREEKQSGSGNLYADYHKVNFDLASAIEALKIKNSQ